MSDVKARVIATVMGREYVPVETVELKKDEVVVKVSEGLDVEAAKSALADPKLQASLKHYGEGAGRVLALAQACHLIKTPSQLLASVEELSRIVAPEPNNDATGVSVEQNAPSEPKKPFIRFEMAWHKGGAIWPQGECDLGEFYRLTGLDDLPSVLPR